MTLFGDLLRQAREAAGLKQGRFAREMGLSVAYVCDVELGRRSPFNPENIKAAARILGIKAIVLEIAAAETLGAYTLAPLTAAHRAAGRALMHRWLDLKPEQLQAIVELLEPEGLR